MRRAFLALILAFGVIAPASAQQAGLQVVIQPCFQPGLLCDIGTGTIGLTDRTRSETFSFEPSTTFGNTALTLTTTNPGADVLWLEQLSGSAFASACAKDNVGAFDWCVFYPTTSSGTMSATTSGTTLTVVSLSAGLVLGPGQSVTGAGITAGTYIVSGSGSTWTLSQSSTVAVAETMTVTLGGMSLASQCSPPGSFSTTSGCYNWGPFVLRQERNNGGVNQTIDRITIDYLGNIGIAPHIHSSAWVGIGLDDSTGNVGVNCAATTGFAQPFTMCQLADARKGLVFDVTAAPSPAGGEGTLGSSGTNGLEAAGKGSVYDIGLMNWHNAVAAGVLTGTTNFQVVGGFLNPGITADTGHTDATVCEDTTTHQFYSGTGTLGVCLGTSSARFKHDIAPLSPGLAAIMALKPDSFRYNAGYGDGGARMQFGLIAEDVASVLPDLVSLDAEGKPNSVDLMGVVPVLVRGIQQQTWIIGAMLIWMIGLTVVVAWRRRC